jgi:hypothetical protein
MTIAISMTITETRQQLLLD